MALRTARRLVVRGRPPGRAAGRTGATRAHAALVRSVSLSRVHRTVPLARASALSRQTSTFQTPSKKSPTQQRADRIEALAQQLALPRAALEGNPRAALLIRNTEVSVTMFTDPDPFQEFAYPNVLAAKRAIADYLAMPLAKLPPEQLEWINTLVETTLCKKEVIEQVEEYFGRRTERESPC